MPINIRIVRPATDDEIDLWRWHYEMVAAEKARALGKLPGKPLFDAEAQTMTDWTLMSVPGRENADGTESPTAWFRLLTSPTHSGGAFSGGAEWLDDQSSRVCWAAGADGSSRSLDAIALSSVGWTGPLFGGCGLHLLFHNPAHLLTAC